MGRVGVRAALTAVVVVLVWLAIGRASWIGADLPVSQLATAAAPTSLPTSTVPASVTASTARPAVSTTAVSTTTTRVITIVGSSAPPTTTTVAVVLGPATTAPAGGDAADRPLVIATPPSPNEVGTEALGLVRYDWRSRFGDWEVVFEGAREGLRALTFPRERRIEVFVRPSDTPTSIHRVLAHEIGHLVDVEANSDADRERWRRQRGLGDAVSWWPSESEPDFATGAGDFAEAFAVWETGVISHSTVAQQPNEADLDLLEELAFDR